MGIDGEPYLSGKEFYPMVLGEYRVVTLSSIVDRTEYSRKN
jgi:hypothetical protein